MNSLDTLLAGTQAASEEQATALAAFDDTVRLMQAAAAMRDQGFGNVVTYSRKVFLPLTHLCRDVCHYCTFAKTPRRIESAYMSLDEVLGSVREAHKMGCKEALFTLGEKPELRYSAARRALDELGFASTLEYVAHVARAVLEETGVLPHINAGCMTADEIAMLRPVSASMGIMLESASSRLCEKGMPHHGSPDKDPQVRLETIRLAGEMAVPFTSGILIGIGETRLERIESMLALRALHQQYGHIQEIIIQNFRAKPDTKMAQAPEPDLNDLLWTIAVARLIFGPDMSIQAPPNLSPGVLPQLVASGLNDWGGVSPVTPDFVNPEAPWPHVAKLARETAVAGKYLEQRLTIYPAYVREASRWLDQSMQARVKAQVDAAGHPYTDSWRTGESDAAPSAVLAQIGHGGEPQAEVRELVSRAAAGERLDEQAISRLFEVRGDDFAYVCQQADKLREATVGNVVRYVVNRNINYTNICYFKCQFCAFSKGKLSENLRGRPYDLSLDEVVRRALEAQARGATEVCLQGGIHPEYTGETYLEICRAIKAQVPDIHIHAFSPLEVWQGASTLGMELGEYLAELRSVGLATLPGTAAEILDDEIRDIICPDKINTEQWLEVMASAHAQGIRTTATIMFGHVEHYHHWARHLLRIRDLQEKTGGFTEFVPLPFVGAEAPMFLKGKSRGGPSFRETMLMHAVARLVLNPYLDNIQASWVKLGRAGVAGALQAGANDLGGTLMNESITRAAGATHGQELGPADMDELVSAIGRTPKQRTTLYGTPHEDLVARSYRASELLDIVNTPARKYERKQRSVAVAGD